jgi:glycosyltransferase involved in cell wall biosynthesis
MKRLLMVANPFPPMASAGNARLLRFLRHLPENGWETTVLTARATGPVPVPDGVRIERTVAPGPESLYALARRIVPSGAASRASSGRTQPTGGERSAQAGGGAQAGGRSRRGGPINDWLMIPDPYAGWIAPAVLRGRALLAAEKYDAIFSSSPRPSVHLIAAALAGKSGLPWLADYRDPWTTYQFRRYPTVWHRRTHEALETWALRRAHHVTAVNAPIVDELVARHPQLAGRATVLPNGFDPDEPADAVALGEGFWFVHTGRLYGREPQTHAFLAALAKAPKDVKALFLGLESPFVAATAAALGIGDRVRVEPYVPHARALGSQRAAAALLLVNGRQPESMSSKVFEYLASGRPIFAVSPPGSAARELFAAVGGARCVLPDDDMTVPLADFVDAARADTLQAADQNLVSCYDAGALTAQLAGLLEEITS